MWNLKKNRLLEGRSTVLATKGESGVWLDVGKAAEPLGGGECVRGSPLSLYIIHAHHHVVHCKYIQFCQHTVTFFKTNDKRSVKQKQTVLPWVYSAALRFRLESLHFSK